MEATARQAQGGWLALGIASVVAILVGLAMAAPASGQEALADTGAEPAEVTPAPVTPAPAPEPSPTPAEPEPVAAAASEAVVATEEAAEVVPEPVPPEPASSVATRTLEDTSEAVAGTQVVEEIPEPAAAVATRATELGDEARARAIEVVAATEKAVLPALPLRDETPPGAAAPAPDKPLPRPQAPAGKELLAGAWLGHVADRPLGLPAEQASAGAAAAGLPHAEPPVGPRELQEAPAHTAIAAIVHTAQNFNDPAPLPDRPPFPLGSTNGIGVPGSGASLFVPIAALLALLALASPAILRRLREPPDFPAPTPFVCALERPG